MLDILRNSLKFVASVTGRYVALVTTTLPRVDGKIYHALQPDVPTPSRRSPILRVFTMTRKNGTAAAPQDSTRAETSFRDFAYNNMTPKQLRKRAAPLLSSRELLRNVRGLGPEDQTKFIEKDDQACQDSCSFSLRTDPPLFPQRRTQPWIRKMRNS